MFVNFISKFKSTKTNCLNEIDKNIFATSTELKKFHFIVFLFSILTSKISKQRNKNSII